MPGGNRRRAAILRLLLPPLAAAGAATAARAIIVLSGDGRNLSAPTGDLAGSGWQYEGRWGSVLGTAIAPHFFVTARHVGGEIGRAFWYRGRRYTAIERLPCPTTDLTVWRVEETLPDFAPLFAGGNVIGRTVTVFGRGTARGAPVYRNGHLQGWRWGLSDHAESWGADTVVDFAEDHTPQRRPSRVAVSGSGRLAFTFDARDGAANTCHVSSGDSGGGVFTRVGDRWQLVGIVYGLENGFRLSPTGPTFSAAFFDMRGLYLADQGRVLPAGSDTSPIPGIWYATPIPTNLSFLRSALATGARPPRLHAAPILLAHFAGFVAAGLAASLAAQGTARYVARAARRRQRRDVRMAGNIPDRGA